MARTGDSWRSVAKLDGGGAEDEEMISMIRVVLAPIQILRMSSEELLTCLNFLLAQFALTLAKREPLVQYSDQQGPPGGTDIDAV